MVVRQEDLAAQVIKKVATLQCAHHRAFHLAEVKCNIVLLSGNGRLEYS